MKTKPQSRSDNGLLGLDLAADDSKMGMVMGVQVVPIGLEDYLRQPWSTIMPLYRDSTAGADMRRLSRQHEALILTVCHSA